MLDRLHCLVALLLLLGAACSLSVDVEGSSFGCSDGQCPSGFRCLAAQCTRLDEPDAGAIASADGSVDASADASAASPDAPAAHSCAGPDETYDPVSGHCYFLDRTAGIWADAVAACAARGPGWHLVFVGSLAENTLISQLGDATISQFAWMGASDAQAEGDWRWLDGADFPPSPQPNVSAFMRWHSGEPNNGGTGGPAQNCAAVAMLGTFQGDWDDRQCSDLLASVCETE